jgi:hypothetical protein
MIKIVLQSVEEFKNKIVRSADLLAEEPIINFRLTNIGKSDESKVYVFPVEEYIIT